MTMNDARHGLFDAVCTIDTLTRAWARVRSAHGSAGIDRVGLAAFEEHLGYHLQDLARELRAETYLPMPARRVALSKPNGDARAIGILAVRDRVAQRAVHNVLEPLCERRFRPCSYAYRPGRNTTQAVEAVLRARRDGRVWLADADIANFFDALDHAVLLRRVATVADDPRLLRLIGLWLEAGLIDPDSAPRPARSRAPLHAAAGVARWGIARLVDDDATPTLAADLAASFDPRLEGLRRAASGIALLLSSSGQLDAVARRLPSVKRPLLAVASGGAAIGVAASAALIVRRYASGGKRRGTMQGSVLSPLLSNLYLHPLDVALSQHYPCTIRYADDLLIACATEREAHEALAYLRRSLAALGLKLREDKTSVHHVDQPFRYLGWQIAAGAAIPPGQPSPPTRADWSLSFVEPTAQPALPAALDGLDPDRPRPVPVQPATGEGSSGDTSRAMARRLMRHGDAAVRSVGSKAMRRVTGRERVDQRPVGGNVSAMPQRHN